MIILLYDSNYNKIFWTQITLYIITRIIIGIIFIFTIQTANIFLSINKCLKYILAAFISLLHLEYLVILYILN